MTQHDALNLKVGDSISVIPVKSPKMVTVVSNSNGIITASDGKKYDMFQILFKN